MSSNSQYETYEAPVAYGGLDAPPGDLHSAETWGYGVVAGAAALESAYVDTYRPAYEEAAQAEGALASGARAAGGRRGARRRKPRYAGGVDRPVRRLLPQALVVAFLAGGTSAFVAKDKAIELSVDGRPRTLHTFADDVTELLAQEGVEVGAHDVVTPAPGTELTSGDEIEVRYGRPVRLTLDGQRHEVWTTGRTVEEALAQWGVRAEGAYLSAARSLRIGRAGIALDVRTERSVTVMADGRARTVRTNAATVGEVVEEAGITLRGQDTTSVPADSFPRDGQTVTVLRITGTEEVREEEIPFDVSRTEDPSLFRGTEVVERAGQSGLRRITYSLVTVNGVRQKPRRIRTEVVREPRAQVVKVGTKPMPTSVQGADHLDWQGLAACESGGRPGAVDPSGTYGGLYQFDTQTWRSLGGSGRPQDAPPAEQTLRAKKLYVQRGASPWPHCGTRLDG
ncbi:ubiquitin-like domain-containing protein [Streptomyces sp. NPDC003635]